MVRRVSRYAVRLTDHAEDDIEGIGEYIEREDSAERALHVARSIRRVIETLSELPNRGAIVREAAELGEQAFREVHFKPYRIIYEVVEDAVVVYLIADGRRDMQTLLLRRMLRD